MLLVIVTGETLQNFDTSLTCHIRCTRCSRLALLHLLTSELLTVLVLSSHLVTMVSRERYSNLSISTYIRTTDSPGLIQPPDHHGEPVRGTQTCLYLLTSELLTVLVLSSHLVTMVSRERYSNLSTLPYTALIFRYATPASEAGSGVPFLIFPSLSVRSFNNRRSSSCHSYKPIIRL